ncbi:DOMON-like domain-containing protein nahoda isoform X1 [Rhodnius prolixus]|uniref:DOMON-like domain-containing protein nahoda isoform X1 n=1 Tax=Rhodnius prolixus TaxID=13249 RepID=UPI003D189897
MRNQGYNAMLYQLLLVLYIITSATQAHISLTFPPARKYDLDFLDNGRTKAPCGMPKGTLKTTILAGKPFNITWHLAYPHKGGFRLQVLDSLLRPVLDLTPVTAKTEFVSRDPTLQHYPVQIPKDFECENCTIRLLTEAIEWGDNARQWSCADVDIRTTKNYKEDCSGHGPYLLSKCRCNRLYRGPRCQYRDECVDHIDCGDMGRCVDLQSTSLPSRQCFCEHGWFGPACTKKSPVKSPSSLDLSGHQEKRLSENLVLYWRILEEEKELEVVMVGNVSSYIGIGWRPLNLTEECHNFPHLEDPEGYNPISYDHEQVALNKLDYANESQPIVTDGKSESEMAEPKSDNENIKSDIPYFDKPELKNKRFLKIEPKIESSAQVKNEFGKKRESEVKREINPRANIQSRVTRDEFHQDPAEELSVATRVSFKVSTSKSAKSRSKREESNKKDALEPYAPRNDFSPMDCTDMVIGMARGTSFRIWDFYARDRSTPRLDTFWGGKNDLTAALGFEKDGMTTILFRKKLKGNEPTDHTIEESPMHVIWAVGQEHGRYVHLPKSGLETESGSIKDFYKPDELKYHGHGSQRGVLNLNFFQTSATASQETSEEQTNAEKWTKCKGFWSYPKGCNLTAGECVYYASWHLKSKTGRIHFTIVTKNTNTWTGIAFSRDHKMSQTDAVIGWVDKSGRPFMMDTWIVGQTAPRLDNLQDITNITGRTVDGVTTLTFERSPDTGDREQDLEFTENSCLYMMFPVMGGEFNPVNKRIKKHKSIPSLTASKVCLSFCLDGDEEATPPPAPYHAYLMKIRLRNLGTGFKAPNIGTDEFNILGNTVTAGFKKTVSKLSDFKSLRVDEFSEEGDGVVASMVLEVFTDEAGTKEAKDARKDYIYQLFEEAITEERVSSLTLDPTYFIFKPIQADQTIVSEEGVTDSSKTSQTKLWIVAGCIIALLIMAFMQAVCTICRAVSSKSPSQKEMLAHNSAWKDYSTANTNYAFEPYEAEEKMRMGLMAGTNGSGMPVQDTRSLSRPRNYHNAAVMSRPAYSLPRSQPPAYSRSHTIDHHGPTDRHLQPDFYFMPSQRKYSGEVVRVFNQKMCKASQPY